MEFPEHPERYFATGSVIGAARRPRLPPGPADLRSDVVEARALFGQVRAHGLLGAKKVHIIASRATGLEVAAAIEEHVTPLAGEGHLNIAVRQSVQGGYTGVGRGTGGAAGRGRPRGRKLDNAGSEGDSDGGSEKDRGGFHKRMNGRPK
jgi:hypothetical protein